MEENQTITEQQMLSQRLPNANATLVLGILSIATCWCYGFLGVIMGAIALIISSNSVKMYKANPGLYSDYGNLRAGRICAIIGLSISGLIVLSFIIAIIMIGSLAGVAEYLQQCQGY